MTYSTRKAPREAPRHHWRDTPAQAPRPGAWDVPDAALPIWLDSNGNFCVGLPDAANGRGHTITIFQSEHAMTLLRRLLEARRAAPFARICEPASPTQHLVDAMAQALAAGHAVKRDKLRIDEIDDSELML